jgi:hypothetical protein
VLAKVFLQDHPSSSYFAELEEISSAACRGSTAQENSPPPAPVCDPGRRWGGAVMDPYAGAL